MAMHSSPLEVLQAMAVGETQEHSVGNGSSHHELYFLPNSPKDSNKRRRKKKRGKAAKGTNEANLDNREMHLRKSFTFPSSCPVQIPSRKAFEYEDADSVKSSLDSDTGSVFSSSCPIRSALRGGQECLGLGPRPKLHVRWAQDVRDPPVSTVSHTVVQHRKPRRKKEQKQQSPKSGKAKTKGDARLKREKGKASLGTGEDVPDNAVLLGADKSVSSLPDKQKYEDSCLEKHLQSVLRLSDNSSNQSHSTLLEIMEMAMKHMLLGSKLMDKNELVAAQAEYEAASRMFRMAKENWKLIAVQDAAETDIKKAIQGQALAWIAISTVLSARGETFKSEETHQLALKACDEAGFNFQTGLEYIKALGAFPSQQKSKKKSKCSRAARSLGLCDTIRKDVLRV